MAKYSKKANETVESAMRRRKKGTLKSGGSGKTVKSRKQAIAIGLSEAREKGAKVPPEKKASKKGAKKKGASKKGATKKKAGRKKAASKKSSTRRPAAKKGRKKSSR